jgi:DNA-binding NarL/FixJ family response regulator
MSERARLLLVDDHHLVLDGLRLELMDEFDIVGTLATGAQVPLMYNILRPDVVLLDLCLPDLSGLELITALKVASPNPRILVVTMHNDRVLADAALQAGAMGFIPKDAEVAELKSAIRTVLRGQQYLSPLVGNRLPQFSAMNLPFDLARLTPRQQQIVRLLGDGKSTARIAEELHVSPNTITFHRVRIRKALGIPTEWALMRYAMVVRMSEEKDRAR